MRFKTVLSRSLVVILLLSALLASRRAPDSASLPVKAVHWFLGLDEADKFAVPLQPIENEEDP
jgi:hypothetical protein